jgi:DNA-binding transcriptional regulator LsrR (DeoR family)/transcriptional regulator with XRE-family HTH domain
MSELAFGSRLKELRSAKAEQLRRPRIPQREVAKALKVSPGAYASWESGRTTPHLTKLPDIADYFGVSVDHLLGVSVSVQPNRIPYTGRGGLEWSLRRPPQTEDEQRGVDVWRRLASGESPGAILSDLENCLARDVERYVLDAVHPDLISVDRIPEDTALAIEVQRRFGLRDVHVVPMPVSEPPDSFRALVTNFKLILLGEAARRFFKKHVVPGMKVGIAGGYSVSRLVYALRRGECRFLEIYPLAISPVIETIDVDANTLVGVFAYRHFGYNVRGFAIQYASPLEMKNASDMMRSAPTRRILTKAKSVDIAFMGVGSLDRERLPINWLDDLLAYQGVNFDSLLRSGPVGDILYHFIDSSGQPVSPEISNLICSVELRDLQALVDVGVQMVVIAAGRHKAATVRAAIGARYANVLIIDDELARELLLEAAGS